MTAEPIAGDLSLDAAPAAPAGIPVLTGGAGPVAVRVFPGLPAQVRVARRWARALASAGAPDPDDVELILGELFANAVLHTRSGGEGGKVTVAVTADGVIHVHDYGTEGPCPGLAAGPPAEGDLREDFGHGLEIVAALCGGLAHLPAAWCPAGGPGDPAAGAGGCCTCCRPGTPAARARAGPGRARRTVRRFRRLPVMTMPLSPQETAAELSASAADLAAALADEEACPLPPMVHLDRVCGLLDALLWAMCREPPAFPLGGLREIARVLSAELRASRRESVTDASALDAQALALAEEAGELVGAYRRWTGRARRPGTLADLEGEVADVLISTAIFAQMADIDIDAAIAGKVTVILSRGWREEDAPAQAEDTP